ncbi:hypothetical protein J4Q44_G00108340 [Coregonus suidteri]|uniref:Uncharacterized protein n=1 Tax=Coregonus suidteri TaxID=861788 RepID=A0AAN8R1R0_9TELE
MSMLSVTVLTILWLGQSARVVWTQGPLPAPSLSFHRSSSGRNIELFSDVELICTLPINVRFPVTVSFGWDNQSLSAIDSLTIQSRDNVRFTTKAIAANEGIYVCWYNATSTGDVSGTSNPANLTISSLPAPKLVVPAFIPIGGNYTVNCQTTTHFPNRTLALYYRELPVTVGNEIFKLRGLAALLDIHDSITLSRWLVDGTETFEFVCRLEIVDFNQHIYLSPPSSPLPAIAEEAPIRLVPQYQGSECLGQLEVQVRGSWGPVCQDRVSVQQLESWNRAMGSVVCRELGCGTLFSVSTKQDYNRKVDDFSMGSILCRGSEGRLRECQIDEVQPLCSFRKGVKMVCSDALPTPKISVTGYREVSRVDISDEHSLELSCMFNAPWFGTEKLSMYLTRVSTESYINIIDNEPIASGEELRTMLHAPVISGEYACRIIRSEQTGSSVRIFVSKWHKPNVGLIITALLTAVSGVAILVYMCVYRVQKGETTNAVTSQGVSTAGPEAPGMEGVSRNMQEALSENLHTTPVQ